jgi:rubrerythrin
VDLSAYGLEEVYLSAIRSEVDSATAYTKLAKAYRNAFLSEKLRFLAGEEQRHREMLEKAYRGNFPGKEPVLPERSPVPLPEINISDESVPLSEVLESAMEAENAASDFYISFAGLMEEGSDIRRTLEYFSLMEQAHYSLLAIEKENSLRFEEYDEYWPMMHAGP